MSRNSISVRGVKKLDIICIFPFKKLARQCRLCTYLPATVINFCQTKYPLGLICHFSHVQQHANCVACLQTWVCVCNFAWGWLMQKFFSSCHRRSVFIHGCATMAPVSGPSNIQYIYHYCGIFYIPSFSSEKENICCLTSRGCMKLHFALFALILTKKICAEFP